MKKIAIFGLMNRHGRRHFGGAAVVIGNLANEFAQQGCLVELLVFQQDPTLPLPFETDSPLTTITFAPNHNDLAHSRLQTYLQQNRPDALLAVGTKANTLAIQATGRSPGITQVWLTLHHAYSEEMRHWTFLRRWRRRRLLRQFYQRSTGIIAVSRGVAEDFAALAGVAAEQIRVIYNPIVQPKLTSLAAQPVDHPWFAPGQPPVVMSIGRLTAQKDFPTLLRAFREVRRQRPCRLVILGEGEARQELETLAEELNLTDAVQFPGFVMNPFAYLSRATLFALSSAWEGFGNVLAEALAVGIPVVATDCCSGPREILDDGRYGTLVPVGNAEALAQAILQGLESRPDKALLQSGADRFRVSASARKYLEVMGLKNAAIGDHHM